MPKIKDLEAHFGEDFDALKQERRELQRHKVYQRTLRIEKKRQKMDDKFKWLHQMELRVIEDGRVDFNSEELYKMLFVAYHDARIGKRNTFDVQRIETNLYSNLLRIAHDIECRTYHPLRSEAFIVREPVIREIFAASFRDRIVHHLLINICMRWWDRRFIRDSYSCRVGKGTHYGVKRMQHHITKVSQNYSIPTYVVKMDIKGFFMSMDRKMLLSEAQKGVRLQFRENFGPLARLAMYLWREIIMDDPVEGAKIRGKPSNWDDLPKDKSLFYQTEGHGIVIGNLTSQLLSNIYLDTFDKFVVYELGYNNYGRYVDDFYVVIPEDRAEQLKRDIERIREYLLSLGLVMHPHKTTWLRAERGVRYLGHFITPNGITMDKRYRGSYYRALTDVVQGRKNIETLASFMGGCTNFGCDEMQRRIWEAAGQIWQ